MASLLQDIGNSNVSIPPTALTSNSRAASAEVLSHDSKISSMQDETVNAQRERRSKKAADAASSASSPSSTTSKSNSSSSSSKSLSSSKSSSSSKPSVESKIVLKRAAIHDKPKYVGQGLRQVGNKIFYEALIIKGDQYIRPGDSMLLQSGESGGVPYICRCTEMWCDVTKEEAMLRGQWFYRQSDIDASNFNEFVETGDTEIYLSNEKAINSAETVLSKIQVIYGNDAVEIVRQKKERAKQTKQPLFYCGHRYATKVKKGASHFSKFRAALKVTEQRMLSIKDEEKKIKSSHRRAAAVALLRTNSGSKVDGSGSGGGKGTKRTHSQAALDVPPLLGLQRRKSVEFLDPQGGQYTYTVYGGSSFKVDGTIDHSKKKKTRSRLKKQYKFRGKCVVCVVVVFVVVVVVVLQDVEETCQCQ